MDWQGVNTESELRQLDERIVWDDSSVVEFHATSCLRDGLPTDVSRSGFHDLNLYLVIDDSISKYEFALIACDRLGANMPLVLSGFRGRIDSLKRVEIRTRKGETVFRCARLAYREIEREGNATDGLGFDDATSGVVT